MGVKSFLLDTHVVLWWLFDDPRLSQTARAIIASPETPIYVSSASIWEITAKHRLGKLDGVEPFLADVPGWLRQASLRELPISILHAQRAGSWPQTHRDPFDRMLAAQASLDDLCLISGDAAIDQFGIQRIC